MAGKEMGGDNAVCSIHRTENVTVFIPGNFSGVDDFTCFDGSNLVEVVYRRYKGHGVCVTIPYCPAYV